MLWTIDIIEYCVASQVLCRKRKKNYVEFRIFHSSLAEMIVIVERQ